MKIREKQKTHFLLFVITTPGWKFYYAELTVTRLRVADRTWKERKKLYISSHLFRSIFPSIKQEKHSLGLGSSIWGGGNQLSESMKSSRFSAGLNNEILATDGIHNHRWTCSTRPCLEFFVGFFPPFLDCNSFWGSSWIRKISNCLMLSDHNNNLGL